MKVILEGSNEDTGSRPSHLLLLSFGVGIHDNDKRARCRGVSKIACFVELGEVVVFGVFLRGWVKFILKISSLFH